MKEMIHNSRATVYSSGLFSSDSYLSRKARQILLAKYSIPSGTSHCIWPKYEGRSGWGQDSFSAFISSPPEHGRRN